MRPKKSSLISYSQLRGGGWVRVRGCPLRKKYKLFLMFFLICNSSFDYLAERQRTKGLSGLSTLKKKFKFRLPKVCMFFFIMTTLLSSRPEMQLLPCGQMFHCSSSQNKEQNQLAVLQLSLSLQKYFFYSKFREKKHEISNKC